MPHDPRQFGCGVVELAVADQVGLAAGHQLLLDIGDRHGLRELLRLAAGAKADIDGHVVAGLPVARIDIDPGIAQPHRLLLLAVLPDRAMQQRERYRARPSAMMRAISFIRICEAENTCATAVADWFCSALASMPWLCRLSPLRVSSSASRYCSIG